MIHHSFLSSTKGLLCLLVVVVIHSKFVLTYSPVGTMGGGAALVGNKYVKFSYDTILGF